LVRWCLANVALCPETELAMNKQTMKTQNLLPASGACHCARVQFEVMIESQIVVQHCNCSICRMTGFVHLIVPGNRFRLVTGADQLTEYRFNSGVARHLFCSNCGVKSFYVPRSNPDGYSVNLLCLKLPDGVEVTEQQFDGKRWERNALQLRHLSQTSKSDD